MPGAQLKLEKFRDNSVLGYWLGVSIWNHWLLNNDNIKRDEVVNQDYGTYKFGARHEYFNFSN